MAEMTSGSVRISEGHGVLGNSLLKTYTRELTALSRSPDFDYYVSTRRSPTLHLCPSCENAGTTRKSALWSPLRSSGASRRFPEAHMQNGFLQTTNTTQTCKSMAGI